MDTLTHKLDKLFLCTMMYQKSTTPVQSENLGVSVQLAKKLKTSP